jgi:cytochrome c-type biogenesis protein CcmH/NrfG
LLAERYLAYEPGNAEVELILARTLMRERAYEEALPLWEKLSESTPEEAHYHLQIARCHARQGRSAAVAAARKVLELDSSIAEANSIIRQFEPRTDYR